MLPSLLLGISLSAACGLRLFLPALALSAASWLGFVTPSRGFEWIGSLPALIIIAVCAVAELAAYATARAGRFLELFATPAAMVAGTLLTGAVLRDASPIVGLALPLVVGGGVAGLSQSLASFRPPGQVVSAAVSPLVAVLALFFPVPMGSLVIAYFAVRWKQVGQAVTR